MRGDLGLRFTRPGVARTQIIKSWNGNEIVLEFLVDSDFNDEDRERMEVVASEVVADFGDETIRTVFTSIPSDGPKAPVAKRWWAYKRFPPNAYVS